MKLQQPYKCDYCDNVKGEANHWWLRQRGRTTLPGDQGLLCREGFVLIPWDDAIADCDVEHICSENCATKALAKWMAGVRKQSKPELVDMNLLYETQGHICDLGLIHSAGEVCTCCGVWG